MFPDQQDAIAGPITTTAAAATTASPSLPTPRPSPSTGGRSGAIAAQQAGEESLVPPPAGTGGIALSYRIVRIRAAAAEAAEARAAAGVL